MRKNKKAQMDAVNTVIGLIAGVGVAVLVLIFVGVLGGQTYEITQDKIAEIGTTTAKTYEFTASNASKVNVGATDIVNGSLSIRNSTGAVGLGNFSIVDYENGSVQLASTQHGLKMNATYNYDNATIRDHVNNGIISGFSALEQTGDYLPIVVLAIIIAVVLALVLGMTGINKGTGGGTAL